MITFSFYLLCGYKKATILISILKQTTKTFLMYFQPKLFRLKLIWALWLKPESSLEIKNFWKFLAFLIYSNVFLMLFIQPGQSNVSQLWVRCCSRYWKYLGKNFFSIYKAGDVLSISNKKTIISPMLLIYPSHIKKPGM